MNTLGSLLVHVDASPRSETRLALAQQLAAACSGAAIEAFYSSAPSFADMPLAFGAGASGAMTLLDDLYERRHLEARRCFARAGAAPGALPMSWLEVSKASVVAALVDRALYADLLFLGQHVPDEIASLSTPADLVQAVLIDSGKPAIVVPHAGTFSTLGRQVLVAWKPTREAARALAAALPLLQRASTIHLAVEAGSEEARGPLEAWMRAHGIEARLQRHAPLGTEAAGDSLLSLAADVDADLLVMGCYGHSRAHEWIAGGVTRTVLRSMTLPVLMAH